MAEMLASQPVDWLAAEDDATYRRWRAVKLETAEKALSLPPIPVSDLAAPTPEERAEMVARCESVNFAHYVAAAGGADDNNVKAALRAFAAAFGLRIAERHRSADASGIVALRVSDAPAQRGYIPYSTRAMNWHTDGYYNAPQDRIGAFVLHCVQPAPTGGENQILDPEIAYMRLRDENPAYVRALAHPEAMTIPENVEPDGRVRPASVGPVFSVDAESGRLQMRYTARTRSIAWRDDALTREAAEFLRQHLAAGDPLALHLRLGAGEGILNNNVLHNRTGFDDGAEAGQKRIIYRVRFHNRVGGNA